MNQNHDADAFTPLFAPGDIVATQGAVVARAAAQLAAALTRHLSGDWGLMFPEDASLNVEALQCGDRLHSAYAIDPSKPSKGYGDNTLWIITEADRSVTRPPLARRVLTGVEPRQNRRGF
jgi:hypothetical protein